MTLKKTLVDAHVVIDVNMRWVDRRDMEYYAKRLESEARDIKDFVRDHKSMDINDVYVEREYEYVCEHCKCGYKEETERPECCNDALREWATHEELVLWGYEEA